MARRKPQIRTEELSIVKAAAWAWYQHGSGSEGKPMREFDLTRTCHPPTPSRYKLEAMRRADDTTEESKSPSPDNSLLDPYEIERISRHLDYLIASSLVAGDHPKNSWSPERDTNEKKKNNNKKKNNKLNAFWLRHGVACGSSRDVVDGILIAGSRRPEPKPVPVVRLANSRPRATHVE